MPARLEITGNAGKNPAAVTDRCLYNHGHMGTGSHPTPRFNQAASLALCNVITAI
jgi:hypothetical protein